MAAVAEGNFIIANIGSGLVVDLKDRSTNNGATIQLYYSEAANTNVNQVWTFEKKGSDWKIQNVFSKTYMGTDLAPKDHSQIKAWQTTDADDNATWTLIDRSEDKDQYMSTHMYTFQLKDLGPSGKLLALDNNDGGRGKGTKLQVADLEDKLNKNQIWWLIPCNK